MKIKGYNGEAIRFTDGSSITFDHEQDCCEWNYADFSVLDVFYHGEEFKDYHIAHDISGFLLILEETRPYHDMRIFIPCYSEQNGYYTDQIDIYVNNKSKVRCLSMQAELVDD